MKTLRLSTASVLALLACGILAGCHSSGVGITVQIQPNTSPSIDEGQSFTFTATVGNDVNNAGVTWTLTQSNCAGAGCGTLSNASAFSVTYVAPTSLAASQSVTLTAASIAKGSATATATITVQIPPTFTTSAGVPETTLASGANGMPYNQTIVVTGGVTPIVFSLGSGSLPSGLTLNQSGSIVGTPSGSGTSNFTVRATDSGTPPFTVSQPFSITIAPASLLSITSTSLPIGSLNAQYNAPVSATGGVTPFAWSIVGGGGTLPPGLSINPTSGQITGLPTTAGTYPFTVQVQDSTLPTNQIKQKALSITIQQPAALQITPLPLPSGATATAYPATTLAATGGIPPYTWNVVTGQLPGGLSLAPGGTISGIPVLVTSDTFTVQVTDSGVTPSIATQSFTIAVTAGTTSGNTLFNGPYSFLFQGFDSGGTVAIAGTLTADGNGKITAGLEDSNRVSGVILGASLAGTYSVGSDGRGTLELVATNSNGVTLTTDYQLVIDSNLNIRFIENNTTSTSTDTLGTHGEGVLKPVTGSGFGAGNFTGNYAFEFSGQDLNSKPAALAGVIHADGSETLSNGTTDFNDAGASSSQSLSGQFAVNSTTASRGTAQLVFQVPSKSAVTLQFSFYFISSSDIYMVEIDSSTTTQASVYYRLSGEMIFQQAAYTFQNSSFAGASVVTGSGINGSNASVFAGLIASSGNGNVTFNYDENNGGTATFPAPSLSGTYSVTPNGRAAFVFTGTSTPRLSAAYLTGPGQGFLIGGDTAVSIGRLEEQSSGVSFSTSSFQGGYTLSTPSPQETKVTNVLGQTYANGGGSVNGTIDEIDPSGTSGTTPHLNQSLVATVNTVATSGRGIMTTNSPLGFPTNVVFYIVSPGSVRAISADSNPGNGHPEVIFLDH